MTADPKAAEREAAARAWIKANEDSNEERLKAIEDELATLACSDGGCVVRRPRGQHTNGGCRCLGRDAAEWTPARRATIRRVLYLRQEQAALLARHPTPSTPTTGETEGA